MINLTELFRKNRIYSKKETKNIKVTYNGFAELKFTGEHFGGRQINSLLGKLYFINAKYGKKWNGVLINLGNFIPKDKMTYIMLECIIFSLLQNGKKVYIIIKDIHNNVQTNGLFCSLLIDYATKKINQEQFMKNFLKRIYKQNYRRIISSNNSSEISDLMTELKTFLKCFYDIDKVDRNRIAEIISELADNACEHAKSDCLIDIDVSTDCYKKGEENGNYYSVNICIINFSNICLGDKIRDKILEKNYNVSERYKYVEAAFDTHKRFFGEKYTENHFFMITAFQNEISGRNNQTQTGGKGLTELIKELEKHTEAYDCYVLSGNDVLFFYPDCLEYKDGWVGFNDSSDYLKTKPDEKVLQKSATYLTGTGYNISLIYRRND